MEVKQFIISKDKLRMTRTTSFNLDNEPCKYTYSFEKSDSVDSVGTLVWTLIAQIKTDPYLSSNLFAYENSDLYDFERKELNKKIKIIEGDKYFNYFIVLCFELLLRINSCKIIEYIQKHYHFEHTKNTNRIFDIVREYLSLIKINEIDGKE